jgi:hypothetical protein
MSLQNEENTIEHILKPKTFAIVDKYSSGAYQCLYGLRLEVRWTNKSYI